MPIPTDQQALTELFEQLGADDPQGWARSQTREGINQLHRFLFLRQAWQCVVSEDDDRWIDDEMEAAEKSPDQPYAGVGHALSRMLQAGVAREDIVDLVRGMQAQALFSFCYLLEDPSLDEEELEDVGWALVETTADFEPTSRTIYGLHESILETDPTGREMRPRKR